MSVPIDDFPPRDYQVSLREVAIAKNSLIYLPTGSGKTFIAVLVLKHFQQTKVKYTEGGKVSFILVNTVALVDQHAKCIEKRTDLDVGRYTGDMNLDFWPKTKWYEEFDKFQVFVMTVQILLNLVNQNFLDLNKVNLMVFDECHRGVNDQPMRQLCKSLENVTEKPRILGLTATLLNGNCKPEKVYEEVRKLEVTYQSQVATVDGLSRVAGYSTNPQEFILEYTAHNSSYIEKVALNVLEDVIVLLGQVKGAKVAITLPRFDLIPLTKEDGKKRLINIIQDIIFHIKTMGVYGGSKAVLAHIIQVERLKKHCDDATLFEVLNFVETNLSFIRGTIDNLMKEYSEEERIFKFSSHQILQLINIFNDYHQRCKEDLCALVFTRRRFTAKVIFYIIKSLSENSERFAHLKPNFMVGCNANPYKDTREVFYNSKKNREVLQSFDNKETNVLCASNVLEEGVDITTCSLVIKYNFPDEYRSYIQSKGRARHPASLYYIMVPADEMKKFQIRYHQFQAMEKQLELLLVGKNELRSEPSEEEINQMYNEDEIEPYYVNGPGSAKVDMVSAISLLSQYCNSLPCDKYTSLSLEMFMEHKQMADGKKKIRMVIQLPLISPLSEPVEGPYMSNKKSAKRAVALLACKRLHQIGELDDHLLPRKYSIENEDVSFLFTHYPNIKEEMAGTNKMKRLHKKLVPQCLRGPIMPNQPAWLHIIDFKPVFQRREYINHATMYDMYTSNLCFGIVTPHPVASICEFPIYVSMGTLDVELKINTRQVSFTHEEILMIREFGLVVFRDILDMMKDFMVADNGDKAETMLVVPVKKDSCTIDNDVLNLHRNVKDRWREPTGEERLRLNVTQEDYNRKIVSPWYRDMGNFLVTEVTLSKTAKTLFPNEEFGTYEEYYRDKHSIRLMNPIQPLLCVKKLSRKTRFFKPPGAEAKKKRERSYAESDIHLIPELIVKQDFPAELWIQAYLLPTVLSRFSCLFRLEEFRVKMAKEMGIDADISASKEPLELDLYLLNYVPQLEEPKPTNNILFSEPQSDINVQAISTINASKGYAKKMLEQEYPWKDSEEPVDVERHLDVTLLDIEYYETFISKRVVEKETTLKNDAPKIQRDQLALTYFKSYEYKPIRLLENQETGKCPELKVIYKAMTTAKANDIVNMERLETLGDSFLKVFSSIYIYMKFPKFTEGLATSLKGRLVSNKNLFYLANRKKIGNIMKANDLAKTDYLPPAFKVPELIEKKIENNETSLSSIYFICVTPEEQKTGQLSSETIRSIHENVTEENPSEKGLIQNLSETFKSNYVGDKKLADCVEALLGAHFLTGGIVGGINFIEWIGLIPRSDNLLEMIRRPVRSPILKPNTSMAQIYRHIPHWETIEKDILGYSFKNKGFLLQALTHSSYSPNRITQSYEMLEYIGDAVIDFLITCHIYESCGNLDPGELTDLRSALVNNNTFASLIVRNNFHKYLLMINNKLQTLIDRFAEFIESKRFEIDDEVLILIEEEDAEALNLAEYIDVPKVLGDMFESLIGAVYFDSGKDLEAVWKVLHRLMWKEIDSFSRDVPKNLVRRLYEYQPNTHPEFGSPKPVEQGKVMVPLQFMMNGRRHVVYGFGSNKDMARKAAAKLALRQLN